MQTPPNKAKFNPYQLRVGDACLIELGNLQERGEVIIRGKTYLSSITIRCESGHVITFDKKCPYRIVAGARNVDGHWRPL